MAHAAARLWANVPRYGQACWGRGLCYNLKIVSFEQQCSLPPKGNCRPRCAEDPSFKGAAQVLGCPARHPLCLFTTHPWLSAAPLQDALSELCGNTANRSLRSTKPDCRQILHHHSRLQQWLADHSCRTAQPKAQEAKASRLPNVLITSTETKATPNHNTPTNPVLRGLSTGLLCDGSACPS